MTTEDGRGPRGAATTPRDRALRMTAAEVRARWDAGKPTPFSVDGIGCAQALEDSGVPVVAMFTDAQPTLWLAIEGDEVLIVGEDEDGPMFIAAPEDGPVVAGLRAAHAAAGYALLRAAEPKTIATRDYATAALHCLQFAREDLQRLAR